MTLRQGPFPPKGERAFVQQRRRMNVAKQNIYDRDVFFENFRQIRENSINFNDCMETPILLSLLPQVQGKAVLDLGCGMGQHARQYAAMGAASVLGIDLSEKMLAFARTHASGENIRYQRMAMEELDGLEGTFDLITSSLAFDYVEDLNRLMASIYGHLKDGAHLVFSMSHPMATAYDGSCDRFTRSETGQRLYANVCRYMEEGRRVVPWVVEDYELYHRTFATIVNAITGAGLMIERCEESKVSDALLSQYPDRFGGTVHRPDFVFFRCRKPEKP